MSIVHQVNGVELKQKADQCLDRNMFREAIDLYREAAIATDPPLGRLGNLVVAERLEALQFRRELLRHHPGDFESELQFVAALDASGGGDQVFVEATALLRKYSEDTKKRIILRLIRFDCAVELGRKTDYVVEDFVSVWNEGERSCGARLLRKTLLKTIVSCMLPSCAAHFNTIAGLGVVPPDVERLLRTKAEELRQLDVLLLQYTSDS